MKQQSKAPQKPFSRFLKLIAYWLLLPVLVIYLLVWSLSPTISRWVINDALAPNQLELSSDSSIRLNPFLLKINVHQVNLIDQEQRSQASIQSAVLDINLWALFSRQIKLEALAISDVKIELSQTTEQLKIAGFIIPTDTSEPTEQPTDNKPLATTEKTLSTNRNESSLDNQQAEPWQVSADNITIQQLHVSGKHFENQHQFELNNLHLKQFVAFPHQQQGELKLDLIINGAPLKAQIDFNQQKVQGNHRITLQLEDFDLSTFAYLLPPSIQQLKGKLSIDLTQSLKISADKTEFQIEKLNTQLNLFEVISSGVKLTSKAYQLAFSNIIFNQFPDASFNVNGDYSINSTDTQVATEDQASTLLGYQQLHLSNGEFEINQNLMPQISFEQLVLAELILSNKIKLDTPENYAQYPKNKSGQLPAITQISNLSFNQFQLANNHVNLEAIIAENLSAHILLTPKKEIINLVNFSPTSSSTPKHLEKADANPQKQADTPVKSSDQVENEQTQTQTVTFAVNKISITGKSQFQFYDAGIQPAFSQIVNFNQFEMGPVDIRSPKQQTNFNIQLKTDEYAGAEVKGYVLPFTEKLNLKADIKVKEFSLPEVSPYLQQALGFSMQSGQFDNQLNVEITDGKIKGETTLAMRGLTFSTKKDIASNSLKEQSAMPLNSALSMLMDSQGNLELDIPLSGDVASPSFGLTSFIALITKKAVMSAAESYLIETFVPYANVISVVKVAGEYMLKVRFEDLPYPAQTTEIQTQQQEFVQQFITLMKDKPDTQVKVCAFATPQDLPEVTPDLKNAEYIQQLKTISALRAQTFKSHVVKQGQIESARLLLCQPQIDSGKKALPRIEFEV